MTDLSDFSQFVHYLRSNRIIVASVESCTGGLIAHQLTDIAGASENFWGAWCVYDNSAKTDLGVPEELIRQQSAISEQVARSMAEQGLKRLASALESSPADFVSIARPWQALAVVSTTGVAGPNGGTAEKPVGLCLSAVAIQLPGKPISVETLTIRAPAHLSRAENKEYFARQSLLFLMEQLKKSGF